MLICAEMGSFVHACEGEMVCESVNPKIPYFNAPIYLENKACANTRKSSLALISDGQGRLRSGKSMRFWDLSTNYSSL